MLDYYGYHTKEQVMAINLVPMPGLCMGENSHIDRPGCWAKIQYFISQKLQKDKIKGSCTADNYSCRLFLDSHHQDPTITIQIICYMGATTSIWREIEYEQHEFHFCIQCPYDQGNNHPGDQQ